MMLQTLIENAIKHGISNLEAGGNVLLNSKTDGPYLILEVINDINTTQMSTRENSLGFGLSSSKQRLKLLYENEASLSLNFDHDQAVVLIKIPLNKNINSTNL
jgi:sensor histidine kinase YesM